MPYKDGTGPAWAKGRAGIGRRCAYAAANPTKEEELAALEERKACIEKRIEELRSR